MAKTSAQLDRDLRAFFAEQGRQPRRVAHVGFGTMSQSKIPVRVKTRDNPAGRTSSERAIHPEMFACVDRNGKILGTSRTMQGAMAKAPNNSSYASVSGEWTSDGTHWGVGKGRRVAVREGGRWIVG
jgi:hypothetical protein